MPWAMECLLKDFTYGVNYKEFQAFECVVAMCAEDSSLGRNSSILGESPLRPGVSGCFRTQRPRFACCIQWGSAGQTHAWHRQLHCLLRQVSMVKLSRSGRGHFVNPAQVCSAKHAKQITHGHYRQSFIEKECPGDQGAHTGSCSVIPLPRSLVSPNV
eukprot:1139345-Pelagomonas_calceolata.AAC.11